MKYAQLIKHPLLPIKTEYIEHAKNMEKEYLRKYSRYHCGYHSKLYCAEILDNVLIITVLTYEKGR